MKNDGLTGVSYGGNKVRKLAPLFERLRDKGVQHLVTVGAAGSHHVLATALYGPREGLRVSALLLPQPQTDHAVTVLCAIHSSGVEVLPCRAPLEALRYLGRMIGPNTVWSGPGAIGPCAASGYEAGFSEWVTQRESLALDSETIENHVVAAGSGGTAAGLLAGLVRSGIKGTVTAVAVNSNPTLRELIVRQAKGILNRLAVAAPTRALSNRLSVDRTAVGRGYGYPTAQTDAAIDRARTFGITLEHTYTAKAYSVAEALAAAEPDRAVIFWQTLSQRPMTPLLQAGTSLESLPNHLSRLLRRLD